jgi:hypothetical protein
VALSSTARALHRNVPPRLCSSEELCLTIIDQDEGKSSSFCPHNHHNRQKKTASKMHRVPPATTPRGQSCQKNETLPDKRPNRCCLKRSYSALTTALVRVVVVSSQKKTDYREKNGGSGRRHELGIDCIDSIKKDDECWTS